jgi:hypothetical protein
MTRLFWGGSISFNYFQRPDHPFLNGGENQTNAFSDGGFRVVVSRDQFVQ